MNVKFDQVLEYTPVRLTIYKFLVCVVTTRPDMEFIKNICSFSMDKYPIEINNYRHQNPENLSQKLAVEWTRTFRGVKPGYGPPPARASAYRSCNIEALVKTYNEAGLALEQSKFDPDYLGIQLDFLYELVDKELTHLQQGCIQRAQILQTEQKEFIRSYLDWVSDFCHQAEKGLELPFYKGILLLIGEFLQEEILWLDQVIHSFRWSLLKRNTYSS